MLDTSSFLPVIADQWGLMRVVSVFAHADSNKLSLNDQLDQETLSAHVTAVLIDETYEQ